jgi:hypothetical protein
MNRVSFFFAVVALGLSSCDADPTSGGIWPLVGTIVGVLGAGVFALWKNAAATRVREVVQDAIASAWWVTERNFKGLPGADKATAAMGSLYQSLAGVGIPLDPNIGAQAQIAWAQFSAKEGVEREQLTMVVAPKAAEIAEANAKADAATKVASGVTATELAHEASR